MLPEPVTYNAPDGEDVLAWVVARHREPFVTIQLVTPWRGHRVGARFECPTQRLTRRKPYEGENPPNG